MTGRALASRWHHLMRMASHLVDVAGGLGAVLRSVDVSPDPRGLEGPSRYPEIVVIVDDPAQRAALAHRLGLQVREWFQVPVSGDGLPGLETWTGDVQGVRLQLTGRMTLATLPEPSGVAS